MRRQQLGQTSGICGQPVNPRRYITQCCHSFAAEDPALLSRGEKLALLQRLRDAMKQMHAQLLLRPAQQVPLLCRPLVAKTCLSDVGDGVF